MNPLDAYQAVNRDVGVQIRYCRPRARTQSFIFIRQDGLNFRLDASGGRKAADLVKVTGQTSGNTIHVTSILLGR